MLLFMQFQRTQLEYIGFANSYLVYMNMLK